MLHDVQKYGVTQIEIANLYLLQLQNYAVLFLTLCLRFSKNFQLFVYNLLKKLLPLKRILALSKWGQKCLVSEL